MKKLINKLMAATLFLGVVGNSTAEEYKQIFVHIKDRDDSGRAFDKQIISLDSGDSVKLINIIRGDTNLNHLSAKVTVQKEGSEVSTVIDQYYSRYGNPTPMYIGELWSFTGPMKIQFGVGGTSNKATSWLVATAVVTRAHERKENNITGYSLVLPESTDTNYKLLLESSTDLVDWKADKIGSKAPSNRKRFYRLRAVKE